MKIRLLALVALAIGFAVPSFALEKDTVDPEVRQQIQAELVKFDDAFNNNDAAAIVALFTPDAIEVFGWEKSLTAAFGRHAIERRYALREPFPEFSNKLVQVYPIGDAICAISELDDPHLKRKDYIVTIYIREADQWKIRMRYVH
jgi:hypothetical protein